MQNYNLKDFFLTHIKDTSDAVIITDDDNNIIFMSECAAYILPGLDVGNDINHIVTPQKCDGEQEVEFYEYDAIATYVKCDDGNIFIYKFPRSTYALTYEYPIAGTAYATILENVTANMFTPVSLLFSAVDGLKKELGDNMSEGMVKHIDSLLQNSYRVLKYASNIEALSTVNMYTEFDDSNFYSIDAADYLKKTLEPIEKMLKGRGYEVEIRVPEKKVYVKTDPKRFERIFLLILSEAMKANEGGGRIVVSLMSMSSFSAISISYESKSAGKVSFDEMLTPAKPLYRGAYDLAVVKLYIEQLGGTFVADLKDGIRLTFTLPKGDARDSLFQKPPVDGSLGKFEQRFIDLSDSAHYKEFK